MKTTLFAGALATGLCFLPHEAAAQFNQFYFLNTGNHQAVTVDVRVPL
jgi:hypothetical protein